jgi:hypothetical protein
MLNIASLLGSPDSSSGRGFMDDIMRALTEGALSDTSDYSDAFDDLDSDSKSDSGDDAIDLQIQLLRSPFLEGSSLGASLGGVTGMFVDPDSLPTFGVAQPGLSGPAAHGIIIKSDGDSSSSSSSGGSDGSSGSGSSSGRLRFQGAGASEVSTGNLARKTVDALRQLAREGRLDQSEKLNLITDVIKVSLLVMCYNFYSAVCMYTCDCFCTQLC